MTVYKVTGATAFLGHQPGEEFEAELDPEIERRGKESGSIRAVKAKAKDKEEEADA